MNITTFKSFLNQLTSKSYCTEFNKRCYKCTNNRDFGLAFFSLKEAKKYWQDNYKNN